MANGHGGARPGAGRKRRATVVEQASRRDVVLEVISDEEWRQTVKAWLALAKETPSIIYPLLPYLLGSPKQEHDVKVSGSLAIEAARKVLRVDGGGE